MFQIKVPEPKYTLGDKVYYAFTYNDIVVSGNVSNIQISFEDEASAYYTIISEGKEYKTNEDQLYSNYEEAEKIVLEGIKNLVERKQNLISDLKSSLEKVIALNPKNETLKEYKKQTVFDHTFNIFEKGEEVYFFVNPYYLVDNTLLPIFKGTVREYAGRISAETNDLHFNVEADWDIFRPNPNEIFYTENEAINYSKNFLERKIKALSKHAEELSEKLSNGKL